MTIAAEVPTHLLQRLLKMKRTACTVSSGLPVQLFPSRTGMCPPTFRSPFQAGRNRANPSQGEAGSHVLAFPHEALWEGRRVLLQGRRPCGGPPGCLEMRQRTRLLSTPQSLPPGFKFLTPDFPETRQRRGNNCRWKCFF